MKLPEFDEGAGSATSSNQWSKSKKAIIMDTRKTGNKISFSKAYDVGLILVPKTESTIISIHRLVLQFNIFRSLSISKKINNTISNKC